MKKSTMLIGASFLVILCAQAQVLPLFQPYQNDTLVANDTRLQEKPNKVFTANDVLNKTIVYKNPYPTVTNNSFEGFDAGKIGSLAAKDVYPRLFTAPNEFGGIQNRLQTTNIGKELLALAKKELDNLQEGKSVMGKAYQDLVASDTFNIVQKFSG